MSTSQKPLVQCEGREELGRYRVSVSTNTRYTAGVSESGGVTLIGVEHPNAYVVSEDAISIAVKFKGFKYNPGSPHSGLVSYQPPETVVYLKEELESDSDRVRKYRLYPISTISHARK